MSNSLSDRAGFLIVANLVKYAVGFIMPMVLVRLLTQSDYGSYQQMILISGAAIGILTLGLPSSIYYFYHFVAPRALPALVAQTTVMLLAAGAVATLVVLYGAAYFASTLGNPGIVGLLQIYALSLVLMIGSEHCLHFMISQNRYGLAVAFEIIETVVRVVTLLIPLALGYGLTGLIVGVVAYAALRFIARNWYLLRSSGLQFAGWRQHLFVREQLLYSMPTALVTLSAIIGSTLNRGMLASSFTPAQYAIYSVGALEIPLDVIFQASVANVLRASLPPLVRDGNLAEVVRLMRESVRKLSTIVLPSFVFLLAHSLEFVTLLFTSRYAESVYVFRIYLWLVPLHMLVLSPIPQVFGKPKLNFYIVFVMTGVLVVLGFVLLKTVGFYGPALASVITQYIQVIVYFVYVCRLTHASVAQLMPGMHFVRVLLAALAGLVASYLLAYVGWGSALVRLVVEGIGFSLVFFAAALPLKVFSAQDLALMRRWALRLVPAAGGSR